MPQFRRNGYGGYLLKLAVGFGWPTLIAPTRTFRSSGICLERSDSSYHRVPYGGPVTLQRANDLLPAQHSATAGEMNLRKIRRKDAQPSPVR